MRRKNLGLLYFFLGAAVLAHGDITLAPLITDHAVFQRDHPIPIWGTASAGEKIGVEFHGARVGTTASPEGKWFVLLPEMPATEAGSDLVVSGKSVVTVHDVVLGEVWLAGGQSNMEFPLRRANNAEKEIAAANFPRIRMVKVNRTATEQPAELVGTGGWQICSPKTAADFTAVGYFFARDLQGKLGTPIGIVDDNWGGTPVESWMSDSALRSHQDFQAVAVRWQETLRRNPELMAQFARDETEWKTQEAAALSGGGKKHTAFLQQHPEPRPPGGIEPRYFPTALFNGMINPVVPYGMRGVIWYQGEANAGRAEEYHALFSTLITSWRENFGNENLFFFWVNLANYNPPGDKTGNSYARLREAQTQTLSLPHTGQALAIDVGDPKNIHPTNKQEVGRRLALLAKSDVYDISTDAVGPTFASATAEGAGMRVRFSHVGTGLVSHDQPVQSLEVAGVDKKFFPATGKIQRDTLLVSAPQVPQPVAVRYAWSNSPVANLYNGSGLPAVPFRSDTW